MFQVKIWASAHINVCINEHLSKFEAWRATLEAGSIVDDLRDRFHKHRELLIREKLAEMDDVSPEERQRIARITEELIERVLEQPTKRVRQGGGMRGRLGAVEALRPIDLDVAAVNLGVAVDPD